MGYDIVGDEKEQLDRIVYEIENSKLPMRRLAAELLLLRKLAQAVRDSRWSPPRVRRALDRLPRLSDKEAWDRLARAEQLEAGLDFEEKPE